MQKTIMRWLLLAGKRVFIVARLLAPGFGIIALAACTVTYPVIGRFDDYKEVMVGTVDADLFAGASVIHARAQHSGFECGGTSRVLFIPASNYLIPGYCKGQKGDANLNCSDGRHIRATWEALGCTRGKGSGYDQNGARFAFTFGMSEREAEQYIATAKVEVADKPELPVYQPKAVRKEKGYATGTGFFIDSYGTLVTNFHVVEDATDVSVHWKEQDYHAEIVKVDPANDIAVLHIGARTHPLPIGSARTVEKASDVMTLGYPLISITGQEQKASFGRVNALSGIQGDVRFFQIDVPIQPGNSGGPLLSRMGEVVGIVTATLNQLVTLRESGALPQNVNYAVKVDYLLPLLADQQTAQVGAAREFTEVVKQAEGSVVLVIAR